MSFQAFIKNNKILYSAFWKISNRLPRSLVYPKEYFDVYGILDIHDSGKNVWPKVSPQLADILKTAISSVPYYRNLGLGIKPEDIIPDVAIEVLNKFPLLDKRTVMENPDAFVSEKYKIDNLLIDTSGGSTGQGIKLYTTARQKFIEIAFSYHEWEKYGWRPTSRFVRMGTDGKKKEHEDPFSFLGDKLLISPYHLNDKWMPIVFKRIVDFKAEYFSAYPSCFIQLARYLKENKLCIPTVKGVFLYSESIPPAWAEIIFEVFPEIPILMHYGMSERSNFAWGRYSEGQVEYHLVPVYGWSENYINEDGNHEIVGTSYWNDVMPLIRYKTQDFGLIEHGVIKKLDGRSQDFLITREGMKIPGMSIVIDKFTWDYVDIFQIVQNEIGKVEFHIVPRPGYSPEIENRIIQSQEKKWGGFFDVKIILEDKIERTRGAKQRLIVNNIYHEKFDGKVR